jgi:hypothetical protein
MAGAEGPRLMQHFNAPPFPLYSNTGYTGTAYVVAVFAMATARYL